MTAQTALPHPPSPGRPQPSASQSAQTPVLRRPEAAGVRTGAVRSFVAPPSLLRNAASGQSPPLPQAIQRKVEQLLHADFSDVRVRVGPEARAIGADAFSAGSTIYVAPGRFQPQTLEGQRLIARELVHIHQQRTGRIAPPRDGQYLVVHNAALEDEADQIAADVLRPSANVRVVQRMQQRKRSDDEENEEEEEEKEEDDDATSRPPLPRPELIKIKKPPLELEREEGPIKRPTKKQGQLNIKRQSRAWPMKDFYEVTNETLILSLVSLEEGKQIEPYWSSKDFLADVRHKLSWDYVRTAVEWARARKSVTPLNNVLALAGRFDLERIPCWTDTLTVRPSKAWRDWIDKAANGPPNIFWGDARVNRAIGAGLDLHFTSNPLGHSRDDAGVASPVSGHIQDIAPKLLEYIQGDEAFSPEQVEKLYEGVKQHYKALRDLSKKLHKEHRVTAEVRDFFKKRDIAASKIHRSWQQQGGYGAKVFLPTAAPPARARR